MFDHICHLGATSYGTYDRSECIIKKIMDNTSTGDISIAQNYHMFYSSITNWMGRWF